MPFGFQSHTHDAMENEGEKADKGMRADPVWQTVVNRRNLDIGFQDAKAPFDIGQCLVARDCIGWRSLRDIGQQGKLAIEEPRAADCVFIQGPTETLGGVIRLDEARESGACPSAHGHARRHGPQ